MLMENNVSLKSQLQYEILILFKVKERWSSEEIVKATKEIREKWSKLPQSATRKTNDDESTLRFELKHLTMENSLKVIDFDTGNPNAYIYGKGDNFSEAITALKQLISYSIDLRAYDESDTSLDDGFIDSIATLHYEYCLSDGLILSERALESLVYSI